MFFSSSAGHCGVYSFSAVFRLHCFDGLVFLAAHRDDRLLRRLRVHTKNICGGQNRLSFSPRFFVSYFFLFCEASTDVCVFELLTCEAQQRPSVEWRKEQRCVLYTVVNTFSVLTSL